MTETAIEKINKLRDAVDDSGENSEDHAFIISGDLEDQLLGEIRDEKRDLWEFKNVYVCRNFKGIAVMHNKYLEEFIKARIHG